MRSSAIVVAALMGVASAGMPNWSGQLSGTLSDVHGGGVGPTGRPHLGHGPVSEMPHTYPTGHAKDHPKEHHPKNEHHKSGGMYPSGGHHPDKYHHKPTGMFPTGGPEKHHPKKHHHKPSGSGVGPTSTGYGGSPSPTQGPLTTTITTTSDVTSK